MRARHRLLVLALLPRPAVLASDPLTAVLHQARQLLNGTFNAGGAYPDAWIRDLATFADVALEVNKPQDLAHILNGFFERQHEDGECPGGYLIGSPLPDPAKPFPPCLGGTQTCKNTCETDQESSLVLATASYVESSGDVKYLLQLVRGKSVLSRLEAALDWLLAARWDATTGLLWGGTTMDWGDVQVELDVADERALDAHSHRALDAYDNSLFVLAIRALLRLQDASDHAADAHGEPQAPRGGRRRSSATRWKTVLGEVSTGVRTHLWNASSSTFRPHVYVGSSPFPPSFDEQHIHAHGSLAVAAQAGLLSTEEVRAAYHVMQADVAAVRAAGGNVTIGLTLYPPYPRAALQGLRIMHEYTYQNGGDWSWFGGRWVSALVQHGLLEEAHEAIRPMAARVLAHGFREWWDFHGSPQGSDKFHGSAGVLGKAIEDLQAALR